MKIYMPLVLFLVLPMGCSQGGYAEEHRTDPKVPVMPTASGDLTAEQLDNVLAHVLVDAKAEVKPAGALVRRQETETGASAVEINQASVAQEKPVMDFTGSPAVEDKPGLVDTDGVQLTELTVARGVENRLPLDPGTEFEIETGGRIYAFLRVLNPEQQASEVTVSWAPVDGGQERGTVKVSIGAQKKWRTWAFTRTLRKPGQWQVIVRDASGQVIGRAPFNLVENG
jgi:hypothetical protein